MPVVGAEVRRARRWFWTMVVIVAAVMGVLYRTSKADPAPMVGPVILLSAVVVLGAVTQAGRIWVALEGPARLPRWRRRRRAARRAGQNASAGSRRNGSGSRDG